MMKNTANPEELTPWYVNQTLALGEYESFEAWLEGHPEAKDDLRFWQTIKESVWAQPRLVPPPGVLGQAKAQIEKHVSSINAHRRIIPAIASGIAVTLIVFMLLWLVVKPGITLKWSVNGIVPTSFQIYRAPAGDQEYTLVGEILAQDNQIVYQYHDLLIVPGRSYLYRVEGMNSGGGITFSQAVANDTRSILPGQLSILFTSIIMGYVCLSLLRNMPSLISKPGEGAVA